MQLNSSSTFSRVFSSCQIGSICLVSSRWLSGVCRFFWKNHLKVFFSKYIWWFYRKFNLTFWFSTFTCKKHLRLTIFIFLFCSHWRFVTSNSDYAIAVVNNRQMKLSVNRVNPKKTTSLFLTNKTFICFWNRGGILDNWLTRRGRGQRVILMHVLSERGGLSGGPWPTEWMREKRQQTMAKKTEKGINTPSYSHRLLPYLVSRFLFFSPIYSPSLFTSSIHISILRPPVISAFSSLSFLSFPHSCLFAFNSRPYKNWFQKDLRKSRFSKGDFSFKWYFQKKKIRRTRLRCIL